MIYSMVSPIPWSTTKNLNGRQNTRMPVQTKHNMAPHDTAPDDRSFLVDGQEKVVYLGVTYTAQVYTDTILHPSVDKTTLYIHPLIRQSYYDGPGGSELGSEFFEHRPEVQRRIIEDTYTFLYHTRFRDTVHYQFWRTGWPKVAQQYNDTLPEHVELIYQPIEPNGKFVRVRLWIPDQPIDREGVWYIHPRYDNLLPMEIKIPTMRGESSQKRRKRQFDHIVHLHFDIPTEDMLTLISRTLTWMETIDPQWYKDNISAFRMLRDIYTDRMREETPTKDFVDTGGTGMTVRRKKDKHLIATAVRRTEELMVAPNGARNGFLYEPREWTHLTGTWENTNNTRRCARSALRFLLGGRTSDVIDPFRIPNQWKGLSIRDIIRATRSGYFWKRVVRQRWEGGRMPMKYVTHSEFEEVLNRTAGVYLIWGKSGDSVHCAGYNAWRGILYGGIGDYVELITRRESHKEALKSMRRADLSSVMGVVELRYHARKAIEQAMVIHDRQAVVDFMKKKLPSYAVEAIEPPPKRQRVQTRLQL
jgi:hypothetical protein